jgi:hypothetical protein
MRTDPSGVLRDGLRGADGSAAKNTTAPLRDQEAVCLLVVAGTLNHRPLGYEHFQNHIETRANALQITPRKLSGGISENTLSAPRQREA